MIGGVSPGGDEGRGRGVLFRVNGEVVGEGAAGKVHLLRWRGVIRKGDPRHPRRASLRRGQAGVKEITGRRCRSRSQGGSRATPGDTHSTPPKAKLSTNLST